MQEWHLAERPHHLPDVQHEREHSGSHLSRRRRRVRGLLRRDARDVSRADDRDPAMRHYGLVARQSESERTTIGCAARKRVPHREANVSDIVYIVTAWDERTNEDTDSVFAA